MILCLEWSARRISVALDTGSRQEELAVELPRFRAPEALSLVDQLLADTGCRLHEVSEIRIGRGPGNYSGVRQAFSWAAGACAPGGIRLYAVASGKAQSHRLAKEVSEPFWILGDARRGMWWGAAHGCEMAWELKTPDAWREVIADGTVFSAEADRLSGLPGLHPDMPLSTDLLLLGEPQPHEPIEPLYLHPPVQPLG